jgi:hypothetical protein
MIVQKCKQYTNKNEVGKNKLWGLGTCWNYNWLCFFHYLLGSSFFRLLLFLCLVKGLPWIIVNFLIYITWMKVYALCYFNFCLVQNQLKFWITEDFEYFWRHTLDNLLIKRFYFKSEYEGDLLINFCKILILVNCFL